MFENLAKRIMRTEIIVSYRFLLLTDTLIFSQTREQFKRTVANEFSVHELNLQPSSLVHTPREGSFREELISGYCVPRGKSVIINWLLIENQESQGLLVFVCLVGCFTP